jgi:microcystin-dependent protein
MATIIDGTSGSSIAGDATVTGNLTVTGTLFGGVPSGAIFWFAFNAAPTGYLEANGDAVSRTTYASLFSAIGTTFGAGDGSTTFNLPDLRGEFVRGWDDGRGVDSGRAFGTAQSDQVIEHIHRVGTAAAALGPDANRMPANATLTGGVYATSGVRNASNTAFIGGTETRPRNIALLACIKF